MSLGWPNQYLSGFFPEHGTLRLQSCELRARLEPASEIPGNMRAAVNMARGNRVVADVGVDDRAEVVSCSFMRRTYVCYVSVFSGAV